MVTEPAMLPVDQLKDLVDALFVLNADLRILSVVEDEDMVVLKLGRESSPLVRVFALPRDTQEAGCADPSGLAIRIAAADLEVARQMRPVTYRGCSDPTAVIDLLKCAFAGLPTSLSREIIKSVLDDFPPTDQIMAAPVRPALAAFMSVDSGPTETSDGVDPITALVESGAAFVEDRKACRHEANYILVGGRRARRHGAVEVTGLPVCSGCGMELKVVDEPNGALSFSFHAAVGGEN